MTVWHNHHRNLFIEKPTKKYTLHSELYILKYFLYSNKALPSVYGHFPNPLGNNKRDFFVCYN